MGVAVVVLQEGTSSSARFDMTRNKKNTETSASTPPYSAIPTHEAQGLSCPLPSPQSGFEAKNKKTSYRKKNSNNEVNICASLCGAWQLFNTNGKLYGWGSYFCYIHIFYTEYGTP